MPSPLILDASKYLDFREGITDEFLPVPRLHGDESHFIGHISAK
jgi:hypothetical protein